MKDLKIFENAEFGAIRTAGTAEEPLFCLADVCKVVGLTNPSAVKARLDAEDVQLLDIHALNSTEGVVLGNTMTNFITESGFYDVLLQSSSSKVKPFRKWVTSEVLPSIRKHGAYATDKVIEDILNNPDMGIALLTKLKEERQARVEAEKTNAILMHVNKTYTATEIAKELGMKSAIELNKALAERKVQYKMNDTWVLYSQYANLGYVDIKQEVLDSGRVIYHRRFTQRGREFVLTLVG